MRNISALHCPMPLTATSLEATSSSGNSRSLGEIQAVFQHVPGQIAEVGEILGRRARRRAGSLVGGEEFRRRGRPVVEERRRP